jgi:hypothetical protein
LPKPSTRKVDWHAFQHWLQFGGDEGVVQQAERIRDLLLATTHREGSHVELTDDVAPSNFDSVKFARLLATGLADYV